MNGKNICKDEACYGCRIVGDKICSIDRRTKYYGTRVHGYVVNPTKYHADNEIIYSKRLIERNIINILNGWEE